MISLRLAPPAVLAAGVGLFAGYLPARRASRIDPMRALRENDPTHPGPPIRPSLAKSPRLRGRRDRIDPAAALRES